MRKGRFAGLSASGAGQGGWAARLGLARKRPGDDGAALDPAQAERAGRLLADFEESGLGWFWETDADGRVRYLSEPLARMLGRERPELIGRRFEELLLVEQGDEDETRPALGFHLSSRFPFADLLVAPNGRKDLCWSLSGRPSFDAVGRFLGFRGIGLALSEQQRAEIQASRLAAVDSLTGLANRGRMRAMLDEALANSASRKEGCGLFMIDLDRFKQVNDTLGHPIGDLLLKEVAQRLAAVVGSDGQVGRLGGDEFEVLLPGVDEEGRLAALAERIIGKLTAPFTIRSHPITIGASIGIAISRPGKTLADALIKEADLALYAAKGAGRGTYRFFEPQMHAEESERRMLENDLRGAISAGQLRLVFQPVVSAASEGLTGFEALLRWLHPVRGTLSPVDFLPLAEATGLIGSIGEWVVRSACAEAARWPRHLRLAVNLSLAELEQPQLAATVANALAASGLDPERLELDIPEAAVRSDSELVRGVLAALDALGVAVALDDFGAGATSLLSLKAAPLGRLKIHPQLTRAALPEGSRAELVLNALIGLADNVGMAVTAEGVETLEELALVRRLGCDSIQGFLFGRPMAAGEALALAAASKPLSAADEVRPRPPRHSLIRRGSLSWRGGTLAVRLRNISAEGAMIESGQAIEPGADVELDLSEGVKLAGEVRWSQDGRVGLRFVEAFNLQRLGKAGGSRAGGALKPDYLRSELAPDSPWAARRERLTVKDVKRK